MELQPNTSDTYMHSISSSSSVKYPGGNTILSTPTAPSYGIAPGVISSSRINISKTYPYDNNYGMKSSASVPSSVTGYDMLTSEPNVKESGKKMNLLRRVFPEHKPQMIQVVLGKHLGPLV